MCLSLSLYIYICISCHIISYHLISSHPISSHIILLLQGTHSCAGSTTRQPVIHHETQEVIKDLQAAKHFGPPALMHVCVASTSDIESITFCTCISWIEHGVHIREWAGGRVGGWVSGRACKRARVRACAPARVRVRTCAPASVGTSVCARTSVGTSGCARASALGGVRARLLVPSCVCANTHRAKCNTPTYNTSTVHYKACVQYMT